MKDINWVQIIFSLLGGGAFGAFIKQYYDSKKNKVQEIGYYAYIKSFYDSDNIKLIKSQIVLHADDKEYVFSRIFTGSIVIVNTGYIDFSEFTFGLTSDDNAEFIYLIANSADRHHNAQISLHPSLDSHTNSFDAVLKPFNRKDNYRFDFIITSTKSSVPIENIKISSPHSVAMKLIPTPTYIE